MIPDGAEYSGKAIMRWRVLDGFRLVGEEWGRLVLRNWAAGRRGIVGKQLSYRFAMPSFLERIARIFDFGGTLVEDFEVPGSGFEEDIVALRSDWIAVGHDMRDVIGG